LDFCLTDIHFHFRPLEWDRPIVPRVGRESVIIKITHTKHKRCTYEEKKPAIQ
jgi:hypothetical protein